MCRLSWNLGASTSWNPQGLSRHVMELLYLYHSLNPFHNNRPPKQNHLPYSYWPTHFHHCCYMHVTVCSMLLHLRYCMFITMHIITCCNVKELFVSLFICFVCCSRQQLFICIALTACSLWWICSVLSVVYQPIYGVLPKGMETKKHYHVTRPYIRYTLHWQILGNICINYPRKNSINQLHT